MLVLTLVGGADRCEGASTTAQVPAGRSRFVIGRDPACDWALPDRSLALSARHCEIVRAPQGVVLRDLSTNGTFVNGATTRVNGEHRLNDGDRVEIGPYSIAVALRGAEPVVPASPAAPAEAAAGRKAATVEDTTPLVMPIGRGVDPAAAALTMGDDDEALGLTRIRPVPVPAGEGSAGKVPAAPGPRPQGPALVAASPAQPEGQVRPAPPPPPLPPPPVPAASDERVAPPVSPDLRDALAALGLPPSALAGLTPTDQAARVGSLIRAAIDLLRQQLARQARVRAALGSRRAVSLPAASPLQMAADTDQALRWLLAGDPAVLLSQVGADLAAHDARVMTAFQGAAARLAADLAPQSLAKATPGDDAAAREALYAVLWQRLGMAEPDADWETGLQAAARLHLGAAFDDGH